MTHAFARRLTTVLLASVLLVGVTAVSTEAKPRLVRGSFTATAAPMVLPGEWVVNGRTCSTDTGTEGAHKVTHPFTAPFGGWFRVSMTFDGDWDLFLDDAHGRPRAMSHRQGFGSHTSGINGDDAITEYLAKGEKVSIVACNWIGGATAEVRYVHREAEGWKDAPSREPTHKELTNYVIPAVGTTDYTFACQDVAGCPNMPVWGNDRFLSVRVVDEVATNVAFQVNQWRADTKLYGDVHCGATKRPIEIQPRIDFVSFIIFSGRCANDDTMNTPTSGRIHVGFTG